MINIITTFFLWLRMLFFGTVPTIVPTITPAPTATIIPTIVPTSTPSPTLTPTPKPPTPTMPAISGPVGTGLTYGNISTEKGLFAAHVLAVDLNSAKMITDTANNDNCSDNCPTKSLKDYVSQNGGYAGINGTYFCPNTYPDCASKKDSYDFPVYNSRLSKWLNSDKLGWNERRAIVYTDGSGAHYQNNSAGFGGGLNAGIINYPGLLDNGNIQVDDNQSGLSDKQRAKGTKVGIGIRDEKHIIVVVAYNVNMQEFAYVFKSLGTKGALNLDTGGSTALYYNGRYILGPGRNLPNAIVFK